MVTIIVSDGQFENVQFDLINNVIGGNLKHALEDTGNGPENLVPIPGMDKVTFEMILKFATWVQEHPDASEDVRKTWEKTEFFGDLSNNPSSSTSSSSSSLNNHSHMENIERVFKILTAANYIGYSDLLHRGCKYVADKIRFMTEDEICTEFGIDKTKFVEAEFNETKDMLMKTVPAFAELYQGVGGSGGSGDGGGGEPTS